MMRCVLIGLVLLCAGCEVGPRRAVVPAGSYDAAFNAARSELDRLGFALDRVDARAGVIATRRKTTAGLATPRDHEQVRVTDEFEDLLNSQSRVVRVVFVPWPVDPEDPPAVGEAGDLRAHEGPLVMDVEAVIYRRRITGRIVETESLLVFGQSSDAAALSRGVPGVYDVPLRRDDALSAKIVRRVGDRADLQPLADEID